MSFRVAMPGAPAVTMVTITLDGEKVEARRGEPVAAALVGGGHLALARSPKFHRPRGPSCVRGACDGCLARVDGVPNVMTCLVPCDEGTEVVSQNTLGSREVDFLRVTDWFFPQGMNHHELFAGVPGVQQVMQAFARRVAGLGRLPKSAAPARAAQRRELDVLVVGAGPSGMAVALAASARGRSVEVVDEGLAVGGGALALANDERAPFRALLAAFDAAVAANTIRLRLRTPATGIFGADVLVAGPEGAEVLSARATVLATGAHDGVLAFEGNDVPGVMSARAGGFFLGHGALVGKRIVVVVPDGGGPFGEAFARAVTAAKLPCELTLVRGEPVRVGGASRVKSVVVRDAAAASGERTLKADALLVDAERAPAYELAEQVGAKLVHAPRGFVVATDDGALAPRFWGAGELVGTPFDAEALRREAEALAARL